MHQNERASPSRLDFFRAHYAASTQSSSRKAPIASSRGSYYPSRGTTGSRASAPIFASFPTLFSLRDIHCAQCVCSQRGVLGLCCTSYTLPDYLQKRVIVLKNTHISFNHFRRGCTLFPRANTYTLFIRNARAFPAAQNGAV